MYLKTTINLTYSYKKIISKEAARLSITQNELIIFLILKFLKNKNIKFKSFSNVKYQNKLNSEKWKKAHLKLSAEFYEKCLDLRKFCKLSLSYIVALAIEKFLIGKNIKQIDNYTSNYVSIFKIIENCPTFIVLWGIPKLDKLEELLE